MSFDCPKRLLHAGRWLLMLLPMAAVVGSMSAFFLWSLDRVTAARFAHPNLLYFLPVAGVLVGLLYHWIGRSAEGGNNLIVEQIHRPGGGVPRRMAPLILLATLVTHLFGGSAGREGTAVQMGGSIAGGFCRALSLEPAAVRLMLMAGIAAGFGAVFGTPLAGAVFALEVLTVGRVEFRALLPCLVASIAADLACRAWGVTHTQYQVVTGFSGGAFFGLQPKLLLHVTLAGVLFGLASRLFCEVSHRATALVRHRIAYAPLRPALGGLLVIGLCALSGTRDYLGLGVVSPEPGGVSLVSFFHSADPHTLSWLWKALFTVVTLSCGFKGGEVTPLFFIGAGLGSDFGHYAGASPVLFAALGFVAIFAGATNTPLACTLMGMELFGIEHALCLALACAVAFLVSGGRSGIYHAQRVPAGGGQGNGPGPTLGELRGGGSSGPR